MSNRLAYLLVLVLAIELAVWECFLVPAPPPGLAAGLAVLGNITLGRVGGRLLPGGGLGPGLCWLAVALTFSLTGPLGDVVVPGDNRGVLFLVAGTAAAAVGLGRKRTSGATPSRPTRR